MAEKTSGKRKVAVVFGIIFVIIGVFLLTFGFSFKLMSVPSGNEALKDAQIEQLTDKVNELEKENLELSEKQDDDESVGTIPSTKTVKEGSSTAEDNTSSVPASSSSTSSNSSSSSNSSNSNNSKSSSSSTSSSSSKSSGTSSSSTVSGGASGSLGLSN